MSDIEFSKQEKELLVAKIQRYFNDELDQEIGRFDAEFFLGFINKEIGPYFYNRGLFDAQAVLTRSVEQISDALYEIEKPTQFVR